MSAEERQAEIFYLKWDRCLVDVRIPLATPASPCPVVFTTNGDTMPGQQSTANLQLFFSSSAPCGNSIPLLIPVAEGIHLRLCYTLFAFD